MQIDFLLLQIAIGLIGAFLSGIIAAFVKIYKDAEARNREGDIKLAIVLRQIYRLIIRTFPRGHNYNSPKATKSYFLHIISDTTEHLFQILDRLFEAAAICSRDIRTDAYKIGVLLHNLDPIFIVQYNIWSSNIGVKLPPRGLKEYLSLETRDDDGSAHLVLNDILCDVDELRKKIEKKHFKCDMNIRALQDI
ncbi:MAG: hypothetical protein ACTSWA_07395 [Candidatus Thorarchaeota archaeon]